mmetsp:Transcript_34947/g.112636  ORF Transcript_34947/g.112636 Transcript_34947/m.112636 type:complete len:259 (-) Transcript_34947:1117-1893(-)|eukprot:scaffold931_cov117-Isochrysis_galbana.AAC.7
MNCTESFFSSIGLSSNPLRRVAAPAVATPAARTKSECRVAKAANEPVTPSVSSQWSHELIGAELGARASASEVGSGGARICKWCSPISSNGRATHPTSSSASVAGGLPASGEAGGVVTLGGPAVRRSLMSKTAPSSPGRYAADHVRYHQSTPEAPLAMGPAVICSGTKAASLDDELPAAAPAGDERGAPGSQTTALAHARPPAASSITVSACAPVAEVSSAGAGSVAVWVSAAQPRSNMAARVASVPPVAKRRAPTGP